MKIAEIDQDGNVLSAAWCGRVKIALRNNVPPAPVISRHDRDDRRRAAGRTAQHPRGGTAGDERRSSVGSGPLSLLKKRGARLLEHAQHQRLQEP